MERLRLSGARRDKAESRSISAQVEQREIDTVSEKRVRLTLVKKVNSVLALVGIEGGTGETRPEVRSRRKRMDANSIFFSVLLNRSCPVVARVCIIYFTKV